MEVESKKIVWCHKDDRHVLIIKKYNEIIGLDFMQGNEVYDLDIFSDGDKDLTKFYNSVAPYLGGLTELDRINQAIWSWFDYINS
jgi:hypothetical protein